MTFPTDDVMCLLLAIWRGVPLEPVDGVLTVVVPLRTVSIIVENVADEFDALEDRGWIEVRDPRPVVTEKGVYALRRWLKSRIIVAEKARAA